MICWIRGRWLFKLISKRQNPKAMRDFIVTKSDKRCESDFVWFDWGEGGLVGGFGFTIQSELTHDLIIYSLGIYIPSSKAFRFTPDTVAYSFFSERYKACRNDAGGVIWSSACEGRLDSRSSSSLGTHLSCGPLRAQSKITATRIIGPYEGVVAKLNSYGRA